MRTSETTAAEQVEAALAAALDLLARTRAGLARGETPELDRLPPLLDGLRTAFAGLAEADGLRLRHSLVALLDEAGRLEAQLAAERERLAVQLRAAGARRRAGAAYRRAGGL